MADGETLNPVSKRPRLEEKECNTCHIIHPIKKFSRNSSAKDGFQAKCKFCQRTYHLNYKMLEPRKNKRSAMRVAMNFEDQPETVKAIIECMMEDPQMSWPDMAQRVGVSAQRCRDLVYTNGYISAVRTIATKHVSRMIPKAIRSLDESLSSPNADVKFKSATKILENEKILGPDRVDVTVNDLRTQTADKLQELVRQGAAVPDQVIIDAEVIS